MVYDYNAWTPWEAYRAGYIAARAEKELSPSEEVYVWHAYGAWLKDQLAAQGQRKEETSE